MTKQKDESHLCQALHSSGPGACSEAGPGEPCYRKARYIDADGRHVCGYHNGNAARGRHGSRTESLSDILSSAHARIKALREELLELEEKKLELAELEKLVYASNERFAKLVEKDGLTDKTKRVVGIVGPKNRRRGRTHKKACAP